MLGMGALAMSGAWAAEGKAVKAPSKKVSKAKAAQTDRLEVSSSSPTAVASYSSESQAAQSLQPAITAGASTTSAQVGGISSPLDKIYMGLTSTFHGTPLNNLGSEYSVDRTGKEKRSNYNSILFDSELGTGYRISKNVGVGAVVPFLMSVSRGQGFILGDVGLKVYNNHTIDAGGLHVATNLMLQAPTSDSSADRDMKFAVKTTPSARYSFAHSSFSTGVYTEAKDYLGVSKEKTFKLWALPYLQYSVSDNFALNMGYEMEWHHDVGRKGLGFDTYMTDLQPGVVITVMKGVIVNPYVQFYTMDKVDFDHAAVGAFMSANIL